jgi:thiol:disulfide interchange protein
VTFHRFQLTTIAIAAVLATAGCGRQEAPSLPGAEAVSNHGSVDIKWEKDFATAVERAGEEGKPVLVNFYADWCVWCKRLDSTTLQDARVATMLRDQVVPVRLDVDREGRELSNEYRVDGLPTVLILEANGREIGRIPGYMPPAGFLETVEGLLHQS